MARSDPHLTAAETKGLRAARELEGHVKWLESFTPAALGVLAVASGIYTYLGVSSLLEDTGAMSFLRRWPIRSRCLSGSLCSGAT